MNWTQNGIEIAVNQWGEFIADVDGYPVKEKRLDLAQAAVEAAVKKHAKKAASLHLSVVGIRRERHNYGSRHKGEIYRTTLIGVHRGTRALLCSGIPSEEELTDVLPDTAENAALLERFLALNQELDQTIAAVNKRELKVSGYGRIEPEDYEKILGKLESHYAQSLEASKKTT